jgi:hypothetical protein
VLKDGELMARVVREEGAALIEFWDQVLKDATVVNRSDHALSLGKGTDGLAAVNLVRDCCWSSGNRQSQLHRMSDAKCCRAWFGSRSDSSLAPYRGDPIAKPVPSFFESLFCLFELQVQDLHRFMRLSHHPSWVLV